MNKTNPIGVRFRADLLERLKVEHGIDSPQKALVFYERFFVARGHLGLKDKDTSEKKLPDQDVKQKPTKAKTNTAPDSHLKPQEESLVKSEHTATEIGKSAILKQIEAIRAEKIPPERNTPIGKKAWIIDQKKRIEELEKQLSKT